MEWIEMQRACEGDLYEVGQAPHLDAGLAPS